MGEAEITMGKVLLGHTPPTDNKPEKTTDGEGEPPVLPESSSAGGPAAFQSDSPASSRNADLLIAAMKGSHTEVESLLNKGAEVNTQDSDNGRTALHFAARFNYLPVVNVLLKHPSIDPDISDTNDSDTPLTLAACFGHEEIIQALLKHPGLKTPKKPDDSNNRTPLHLAVLGGHKASVEALLASKSVDVNATDMFGLTPLHLAFDPTTEDGGDDSDTIAIVKALLEKGADVGAIEEVNHETPLHMAARKGPSGAVNALLSHNNPTTITDSASSDLHSSRPTANVNLRNILDYTPLSIAVRHRRTEIVRTMLEQAFPPADLALTGPMDELIGLVTTTLENAVRKGNAEIVALFVQPERSTSKEIDKHWNSDVKCTPLTWAVEKGDFKLVETLLENGAGIDWCDGDSNSPLHVSSELGNVEITELLLKYDPDIDLKKQMDGWTALHYASCFGHDQVIQLLLDKKADASVRTQQDSKAARGGDTPLSLALREFHVRSISVLLRSISQDSAGQEGNYLGLENDSDYAVRYSSDRMKRAAEHKDTHDLVKFVLKQREYLHSKASPNRKGADKVFPTERYPPDFDATISRIRSLVGSKVKNNKSLWTALEWAVYWGKLELVERILVSGNNSGSVREDAKSMAQNFCEEIRQEKEKMHHDPSKQRLRPHQPAPENNLQEDDAHARERQETDFQERGSSDMREPATNTITRAQSKLPAPKPKTPYNKLMSEVVEKLSEVVEKLSEVEVDYIDIQDALRYGIPLTPGIVKIADVNKVLTAPSLDQKIRGLISDFFAGIIDIYNDDDGVALLRRSRRVEDVIYGKGPRAIMESASARIYKSRENTKLKKEDLQLRWVHLPANNVSNTSELLKIIVVDHRAGD